MLSCCISRSRLLPIKQVILRSVTTKMKPKTKFTPTTRERIHDFFFYKNLVFTNTFSSAMFMGFSEFIIQEYKYEMNISQERYNWAVTGRMTTVGACLGFMHHYYYIYLDRLLPKVSIRNVFTKILGDQFFCAPLTIVCFFYILCTLERKTFMESTNELRNKFLLVYTGDWMYWPPVQFINFYYLHTRYRVFYINAATMLFDVFLAYMKHYDVDHHKLA